MTDRLEIIIITYNHKKHLQYTLEKLLSDTSPVKNIPITILDNCSNDGTSQYLQTLTTQHKNIRHIRHNINIGGNANIARAFEITQKEYFWILSDNDDYNFTHFDEVEKAIQQKAGIIVVNTEAANGQKELFKLLRRLTFLPACIFAKSLLDEYTMQNIYNNVLNWFPHFAIICKAINKKIPIHICKNNIVIQKNHNRDNYKSYYSSPEFSPYMQNIFFDIGYLNSLEMISDKKQRALAVKYFAHNPNFFKSIRAICKTNLLESSNYSRNLTGLWPILSNWQRCQFLIAAMFETLFYFIKYPKYYMRRKNKKLK